MEKIYVIFMAACAILAIFGGILNNNAVLIIGAIPIILNGILELFIQSRNALKYKHIGGLVHGMVELMMNK